MRIRQRALQVASALFRITAADGDPGKTEVGPRVRGVQPQDTLELLVGLLKVILPEERFAKAQAQRLGSITAPVHGTLEILHGGVRIGRVGRGQSNALKVRPACLRRTQAFSLGQARARRNMKTVSEQSLAELSPGLGGARRLVYQRACRFDDPDDSRIDAG